MVSLNYPRIESEVVISFLASVVVVLITAIGRTLWFLGWISATIYRISKLAILWSIAAVVIGWKDGSSGLPRKGQ